MSLYFNSEKPVVQERTIERWREHSIKTRKILEGKDRECRDIRNESRRIRYETYVKKTWDFHLNNVKLHERVYEIEVLIGLAESILPKIANEKKLIDEEKSLTQKLMNQCDTWITVCMVELNSLDTKLETELTRNDTGVLETKKEIELLENCKSSLKQDSLLAWEMSNKLEEMETKIELNLEFKKEVMAMDIRNQAIDKMDSDVSYKVEPTKGPDKMLTIDEWSKTVYGLVEKGQTALWESVKLRERMSATRGVTINEYSIQFDRTDFELRKRIYEINREKNESQYQLMKVRELMEVTKAEWLRLELFLKDVKDDLKCAETRCTDRYFRPSVEATKDPPFFGMNQEVKDLEAAVEQIESHLDILKTFYNKLGTDEHKLILESEAKNKSLQIQVQALDIRIADRYDPKGIYKYNPSLLMSKMSTQMPPDFTLYSNTTQ